MEEWKINYVQIKTYMKEELMNSLFFHVFLFMILWLSHSSKRYEHELSIHIYVGLFPQSQLNSQHQLPNQMPNNVTIQSSSHRKLIERIFLFYTLEPSYLQFQHNNTKRNENSLLTDNGIFQWIRENHIRFDKCT